MRTFLPFLPSFPVALLLAATGCSATPTSSTGSFMSLQVPTKPIAAGATTQVPMSISGSTISRVDSDDASVLAVGPLASQGNGNYVVSITGGSPGTASLRIYDASGFQLDQEKIQVAPTTSIPLSLASGATLLEGSGFAVHATTVGAGGVTLVGDGAIHFGYSGSLQSSTSATGGACFGDCGYFRATAVGDGQLSATAVSASAALSVHVVPPSAIDSLTLGTSTLSLTPSGAATSSYTLRAAGAVVYSDGSETTCATSNQSVATAGNATLVEDLGSDKSGTILVSAGTATGTATITCVAGGQQSTMTVTVQ